jgi:heme/copper-type cytochrome/quinol oxidase subunit 4
MKSTPSATKVFKARTDALFNGVLIFSIAICILPMWPLIRSGISSTETLIAFVILAATTLMMIAFYTHTYYTIDGDELRWQSSILFGKFSVSSIQKIAINKTLWVGTRPATARNGIIIYYNKYDEIYFSPSDNEAFATALLEINPEIEVVRE